MTTNTTTPGSGNLLHQIATERSVTTDPARRAQLDQMEMGIRMWRQRDDGYDVILRLAPAPTLECPTWCEEDPGHPWTHYDESDSPASVSRSHSRDLLDTPNTQVCLRRTDVLDLAGDRGEYVQMASRTNADSGTEMLTVEETGQMAQALHEARVLLLKGYGAGDPMRGTLDED